MFSFPINNGRLHFFSTSKFLTCPALQQLWFMMLMTSHNWLNLERMPWLQNLTPWPTSSTLPTYFKSRLNRTTPMGARALHALASLLVRDTQCQCLSWSNSLRAIYGDICSWRDVTYYKSTSKSWLIIAIFSSSIVLTLMLSGATEQVQSSTSSSMCTKAQIEQQSRYSVMASFMLQCLGWQIQMGWNLL